MTIGVTLNGQHCLTDLGMYLTKATIRQPEPKTNYITIPGADGSLDLSTALDGTMHYGDREIELEFETTPALCGCDWKSFLSKLANLFHGVETKIQFDGDSSYYTGRGTLSSFGFSGAYSVALNFTCKPYKLHHTPTSLAFDLTTESREIVLINDRMAVCPEITVTAETPLTFGTTDYTLSAGSWKLVGIQLQEGQNKFTAHTISGTGTITFTYQEGSL